MAYLFNHRNGYYFKRKIPKTQTNFLISLKTDSLKEAKFIIATISPRFLKLFMENIMNWDEEIDYIRDLISEYVDEAKEDYTKYSAYNGVFEQCFQKYLNTFDKNIF